MPKASFDPDRHHALSREAASLLVRRFQSSAAADVHRSSTFNRSAFDQLLGQPGAAGIRIYRAAHEDGSPTLVMVAVNAEGQDLDGPDGRFAQNSHDCPPDCAGSSLAHPS